jgi:hypothetical protein
VATDGKAKGDNVSDVVDLVKEYVKQETVAPLKRLWRAIGWYLIGSFLLGIGGVELLLGFLRFWEGSDGHRFSHALNWLPYVFTFVAGVAYLAVVTFIVKKNVIDSNDKETRR